MLCVVVRKIRSQYQRNFEITYFCNDSTEEKVETCGEGIKCQKY